MVYQPKVKICVGLLDLDRMGGHACSVIKKAKQFETIIVMDNAWGSLYEIWKDKYNEAVPFPHVVYCQTFEWIYADYTIAFDAEILKNDGATRILIDLPDNRDVRDDVYGIYRVKNFAEAYRLIDRLEAESKEECCLI